MLYARNKGSRGSGGWGHDGRQGKHGGSEAGSGGLSRIGASSKTPIKERRSLAKGVTTSKKPSIKARKVREKILTVEGKTKARYAKRVTKLKAERDVLEERLRNAMEEQAQVDAIASLGTISREEAEKRYLTIEVDMEKDFARFGALEEKIVDLTSRSRVIQKQRELLYAKGDPATINPIYSSKFDKDRKKEYQRGVDEFAKMLGKSTVIDETAIAIFDEPDGRSSHSPTPTGSIVNMAKSAGAKIVIHELGHSLESASEKRHTSNINNVHKQATDFLNKRTKGEQTQSLRSLTGDPGYDVDEITKPDKFTDPYSGRIYPHGSTEIISMGLEQMWENPARFAKNDPEYFDFIYTTLEGARTYSS